MPTFSNWGIQLDDTQTYDIIETPNDLGRGWWRSGINSSVDLNLMDNNFDYGWYCWSGSVPSNAPSSYAIMLYGTGTGQPFQLVIGSTSHYVFLRRRNSGNWGSWTTI
jgi:hypothetical protein